VFKEILSMAQKPMTADELQRAKDSMSYSLPGAFESSANAVGNFSNVFVYDLGLDYYSRYAAQVNAVTVDQAAAVARKYLVQKDGGDRGGRPLQDRDAAAELGLGPSRSGTRTGRK
jgi:predicted Zn-dependent peptidase